MRINWKFVSGILAAALAYDEIAGVINKKRFARMKDERDAWHEMTHYLAKCMDENQTPFTEFDQIAINTIGEKIIPK